MYRYIYTNVYEEWKLIQNTRQINIKVKKNLCHVYTLYGTIKQRKSNSNRFDTLTRWQNASWISKSNKLRAENKIKKTKKKKNTLSQEIYLYAASDV